MGRRITEDSGRTRGESATPEGFFASGEAARAAGGRFFFRIGAAWLAVVLLVSGFAVTDAGETEAVPSGPLVWTHRMPSFSEENYRTAVEGLLASFEEKRGSPVEPGEQGRVGLKVYTHSGPGLATPRSLVRAVVESLEERGYARRDIFLVDLSRYRLRQSGFLPRSDREGDEFEGSPVYALETGRHYDPDWHYESPLPPRTDFRRLQQFGVEVSEEEAVGEDRKSYLPYPLLHEADFWINLPRYTDHPQLGVNGALLNATLWNASNTSRFLSSRSTGPAAAAEMAAIPELRRGWVLNLATLESFQFIGGPSFRSLYTASKPELWMSADPVLLDALMVEKINCERKARGFRELEAFLSLLEFSEQIGVGSNDPDAAEWVRLPAEGDG